jgi:uncharacterized protein (DUF58 family)
VNSAGVTCPISSPAELLRRVKLVDLRARRLVMDLLAGPYRSVFRGRGLEFDDIREYQPGDDVRAIDWHATARSGTVQIKQNIEERCLTVMLAVDLSASGDFGSGPQSKRELAAELAAVFALSAVSNNDRVGLAIFTDNVEYYLPPRTGRRQALAIVAAILSHQPRSPRTSMDKSLRTIGSLLRHRATLFLLSDFLDTGFARALRLASLGHDTVAVSIQDPVEASLPALGWLVCEDAETGDLVEFHTTDPAFRHAFEVDRLARTASLQETFRRAGVDAVSCETGKPYQRALLQFFDRRQQRFGMSRGAVE